LQELFFTAPDTRPLTFRQPSELVAQNQSETASAIAVLIDSKITQSAA